jgi:hypothetical protein
MAEMELSSKPFEPDLVYSSGGKLKELICQVTF